MPESGLCYSASYLTHHPGLPTIQILDNLHQTVSYGAIYPRCKACIINLAYSKQASSSRYKSMYNKNGWELLSFKWGPRTSLSSILQSSYTPYSTDVARCTRTGRLFVSCSRYQRSVTTTRSQKCLVLDSKRLSRATISCPPLQPIINTATSCHSTALCLSAIHGGVYPSLSSQVLLARKHALHLPHHSRGRINAVGTRISSFCRSPEGLTQAGVQAAQLVNEAQRSESYCYQLVGFHQRHGVKVDEGLGVS